MSDTVNARIPPRVEQKLGGASGYALASNLIPARGAKALQSTAVRKLARTAFREGKLTPAL
jgi:hypothetical protein